MRKVLAACLFVMCFFMLVGLSFAQCPPAPQSAPQSVLPAATVRAFAPTAPASTQIEIASATPEELQFLATGPRLYPMREALELSKATGKPVLCWMGRHLFADERARNLSRELKDTTIQAAMDSDGTPYDAAGPRVKFSDGNYTTEAKTYYTRLANFDRPGEAEKILAVARGGGK